MKRVLLIVSFGSLVIAAALLSILTANCMKAAELAKFHLALEDAVFDCFEAKCSDINELQKLSMMVRKRFEESYETCTGNEEGIKVKVLPDESNTRPRVEDRRQAV